MGSFDLNGLTKICDKYNAELLLGEKLAPYTSFRIGGKCTALLKVACEDCLQEAVFYCRSKGIPFRILGNGSNILVSDKDIDAVIITTIGLSEIRINGDTIESGAGAMLGRVCGTARDNSLSGLEFAYGIPGTVGGAVYMNAGAYGGETGNVLVSCRYIGTDNKIHEIQAKEAELSYRHSIFCENGGIIISAVFKLQKGDKEKITADMDDFMKKRREKQPLEYPSAGSTFKRPPGDYAARLIDECGLKGFSCGDAEVSSKHSGFVINKGNATFDDVISVINGVKETVRKMTGINLECEVEIIT